MPIDKIVDEVVNRRDYGLNYTTPVTENMEYELFPVQ